MSFKEQYFEIWNLAWNFHKKYTSEFSNGSDFWESAVSESAELLNRYKEKPQREFMKSLLVAVMSELQKSEKGG